MADIDLKTETVGSQSRLAGQDSTSSRKARRSAIRLPLGADAADEEWYFYLAALVIVVASLLSLGMAAPPQHPTDVVEAAFRVPLVPTEIAWNQVAEHYHAPVLHLREPAMPGRARPGDLTGPGVQHHVVKSGDSLTSIWARYGNFEGGGMKASLAMRAAMSEENAEVPLKVGERLELKLNGGDVVGLKRVVGDGKLLTLSGSTVDGYTGKLTAPQVVEEERIVSGAIHSSFSEAAKTSLLPYDIVDTVVDIFDDRIDFSRDLRQGDTFAVKFIHRSSDLSGELTPGDILAASLKVNGEHFAAIRHVKENGQSVYLDENGEILGRYFLKYPVRFSRISSVFADSRLHPVLKYRRPHYGVDFAAPTGTPVRTVGDGVVVKAGRFGGAGNLIKIKHDGRYSTAYLHLSHIDRKIKVGAKVKRGQVIGKVGMTGLATGPHLHFSLYDKGKYIDPLQAKLKIADPKKIKVDVASLQGVLKSLESYHSKFIENSKQS